MNNLIKIRVCLLFLFFLFLNPFNSQSAIQINDDYFLHLERIDSKVKRYKTFSVGDRIRLKTGNKKRFKGDIVFIDENIVKIKEKDKIRVVKIEDITEVQSYDWSNLFWNLLIFTVSAIFFVGLVALLLLMFFIPIIFFTLFSDNNLDFLYTRWFIGFTGGTLGLLTSLIVNRIVDRKIITKYKIGKNWTIKSKR